MVASWLDLDDIAGPSGVFKGIGEFGTCLGMDMKHWLALVDLVAEPYVHANAGGLGLGRASEFGKSGEPSIVDMNDASCVRRYKRMDVGRSRGCTHPALRLTDRFELRPGPAVGERFESQPSPFAFLGSPTDFERCTRERCSAPPEIVRRATGILKDSQDIESLECRPDPPADRL